MTRAQLAPIAAACAALFAAVLVGVRPESIDQHPPATAESVIEPEVAVSPPPTTPVPNAGRPLGEAAVDVTPENGRGSPADGSRPGEVLAKLLAPTELQKRVKSRLTAEELALELGGFRLAKRREQLTLIVAVKISGEVALAGPLASVRQDLGTPDLQITRTLYSAYIRTAGSLLASKRWKQPQVPEEVIRDRGLLATAYLDALAAFVGQGVSALDASQWWSLAHTHDIVLRDWPQFRSVPAAVDARTRVADALTATLLHGVSTAAPEEIPWTPIVMLAGLVGDENTANALLAVARNSEGLASSGEGRTTHDEEVDTLLSWVHGAVRKCGSVHHYEEMSNILIMRLARTSGDAIAARQVQDRIRSLFPRGVPESIEASLRAATRTKR